MKKCNYPVKYALLPIKEMRPDRVGKEHLTFVCYIVAKAYVLEEYKRYNNEGNITMSYKVCFPYVVLSDTVNTFRKDPDSPLARDNEKVVSRLFDNYEDAVVDKERRNVFISQEVLDKYKLFEDQILRLTSDLNVKGESKTKTLEK